MGWSAPATWVAAAIATAAQFNQEIRDNFIWLKAALTTSGITSDSALSKIKSANCGVKCAGSDTTVADSTDKTLTWTSADIFDTDAFHSTSSNPSRITIPSGLDGIYLIHANVGFESNGTSDRRIWIEDSTGTLRGQQNMDSPSASLRSEFDAWAIVSAAAGDWFTVHVYQTSGSTLSVYQALTRHCFEAYRLFAA